MDYHAQDQYCHDCALWATSLLVEHKPDGYPDDQNGKSSDTPSEVQVILWQASRTTGCTYKLYLRPCASVFPAAKKVEEPEHSEEIKVGGLMRSGRTQAPT